MTIAWPDGVSYRPASGGASLAPFRDPLVTDFDDGARRYRRSTTKNIATVSLTIRMTNSEFAIFKPWARDTLVDGTLPFSMPIWDGSDFTSKTCQFTQPYSDDPGSGLDGEWPHTVSLVLDVADY